jgi:hypothetical protein
MQSWWGWWNTRATLSGLVATSGFTARVYDAHRATRLPFESPRDQGTQIPHWYVYVSINLLIFLLSYFIASIEWRIQENCRGSKIPQHCLTEIESFPTSECFFAAQWGKCRGRGTGAMRYLFGRLWGRGEYLLVPQPTMQSRLSSRMHCGMAR